jgi:hypothetical protein
MAESGDRRILCRPNVSVRARVQKCRFAKLKAAVSTVDQFGNTGEAQGGSSGIIKDCLFDACGMGLFQDGPGVWQVIGCTFQKNVSCVF